ncbi:MAG TPA: dipeptidase [Blastocatellia bacterium]|nr:dipeptidase [Blastocatellia bacterium]
MVKSSLLPLALPIVATIAAVFPAQPAHSAGQRSPGQTAPKRSGPVDSDQAIRARAERLHRGAIVVDTHNDVTSPILEQGFDLGTDGGAADAKTRTHTDLKRMKAGGIDAEFFAVYVAAEYVNRKPSEGGGAARRALDVIDCVYRQVKNHPDSLEMAFSTSDIRRIAKQGKIAALLGIEGGHAIENSLAALRMFHQLGVRYMTLTHTNTNDWADSSGDIDDPKVIHHNGLTDFGREVVREMNRIGMMVDISHVSDKTFFDVIDTSKAPIIASHSSARALANHPRNMTDDMLRAVGKNGGVVMVNFYDGFLDGRKAQRAPLVRAREREIRQQYPNDQARVEAELAKWLAETGPGKTPLSVLIDHIDHIAKIAGIDHVGLGSDFDGVPLTGLPEGMEDISKLPNITFELLKRGYTDQDVRKILGANLLRVMAACEEFARAK